MFWYCSFRSSVRLCQNTVPCKNSHDLSLLSEWLHAFNTSFPIAGTSGDSSIYIQAYALLGNSWPNKPTIPGLCCHMMKDIKQQDANTASVEGHYQWWICDWLTCSRLSSSGRVPVSPLLLMGISMVAALLMILSAIMKYLQDSTRHWHIKMGSCLWFHKMIIINCSDPHQHKIPASSNWC